MAVNTPTLQKCKGAGMCDLRYVENVLKIAESSTSDKIVVEKSTLPVRTAEKVKRVWKTYSNGAKLKFYQALNFCRRNIIQDFLNQTEF